MAWWLTSPYTSQTGRTAAYQTHISMCFALSVPSSRTANGAVSNTEFTSWTRTATVSGTQMESLCLTPFPLPTGAVPKRWNTGGRHGRSYATPSLRKRGLTFVSTTEAMSVRAWSFFPPSMRAQPSGQWRRKAYAPRKASSTAGSKPPMPLSGTLRRKSLSCLIGLPKQKWSLPSRRHPTLFLC